MVDLVCDLKIHYCTFFGKIFGWVLQGPIENHEFEVQMSVELSEDVEEAFTNVFEFFECDTETYKGEYEWRSMDVSNRKYSRKKRFTLDSAGKYEMRFFFKSDRSFQIFSKDHTIHTNMELSSGYTVIPKGSWFFMEPLKVHPFLEVFILIFAVISGIGAFFEILSFFFKP